MHSEGRFVGMCNYLNLSCLLEDQTLLNIDYCAVWKNVFLNFLVTVYALLMRFLACLSVTCFFSAINLAKSVDPVHLPKASRISRGEVLSILYHFTKQPIVRSFFNIYLTGSAKHQGNAL